MAVQGKLERKIGGRAKVVLEYYRNATYTVSLILGKKVIILTSKKGTVWDARKDFQKALKDFGITENYSDKEILEKLFQYY